MKNLTVITIPADSKDSLSHQMEVIAENSIAANVDGHLLLSMKELLVYYPYDDTPYGLVVETIHYAVKYNLP